MATNYGMLNNITSGVKEAMTAYQTNKTLQRQEQMQNLLQGAQENPETGELEYTPEMKMKKEAEMRGLIATKNESLGDSEESKQYLAMLKSQGINLPPGTSKTQAKDMLPYFIAKNNADAAYNRAGLLNNYRKEIADQKQSTGDYEFKKLPKDAQITIESLTEDASKQTAMGNQVNELIDQMKDPKMSNEDKVASANEQVKLLNSTLGSDAVGAEEVKRIAKFLDYLPSPTVGKYTTGPDIEGYTRQLENLKKRTDGSIALLKSQVDEAYGRKKTNTPEKFNPVNKGLIQQSTGQTVKVFDPKGNVRIIPKDQLDAAIKAGGKLAE